MPKKDTRLIGKEASWTTRTCSMCGETLTATAKLMITCSQGHAFDQDENASRNLLAQLPGDVKIIRRKTKVEIPEALQKMIYVIGHR